VPTARLGCGHGDIHEFGHQYSPDHLSAEYHEALCWIRAKVFLLARQNQLA
jgi:hypothetical protein